MFPEKLTRREFLEYSLAAAATLMLGCSQKTPVSETETKVESSFSENQDYFEWYPGVPKVTGENFYDVDPKKYLQLDYGKDVYVTGRKMIETYAKEAGINDEKETERLLGETLLYAKVPETSIYAEFKELDPFDLYVFMGFNFYIPPSLATIYYMHEHESEWDYRSKKHIPFNEFIGYWEFPTYKEVINYLIDKYKSSPQELFEVIANFEYYLEEFYIKDPKTFTFSEEAKNTAMEYFENKGLSKTGKIWLGKWAELRERDGLKGMGIRKEDYKDREREFLVRTEGVREKIRDKALDIIGEWAEVSPFAKVLKSNEKYCWMYNIGSFIEETLYKYGRNIM